MTATVLVVGGGPAGLALAIGARRAGLGVTVIERHEPPVDKACGEGLMPDGVAALEALGVDVAGLGRPFHGIRYLDAAAIPIGVPAERAAAAGAPARGDGPPPPVVKARFPGRSRGLGIRRTRLHEVLAAAAAAAGADLRWGVPARGLEHRNAGDGGRFAVVTDGGTLEADWIVAADGLTSRLRRWAGLEGRPPRHPRFGVRRHYRTMPLTTLVEVWWADGCEAYVTPVAYDQIGVAMLWNGGPGGLGKVRFDHLLPRFPALAARFEDAEIVSNDQGAGPLARRPRALSRGNLVLLGDAAGYLDAITGEGLSLAFQQAAALAPALAAGDLASYGRAHRRIARHPEQLIRVLLAIERRPRLRRRMLRALAGEPELFAHLLAVHARGLPLRALGAAGAARVVRSLVFQGGFSKPPSPPE